jgi:hypothetical protein
MPVSFLQVVAHRFAKVDKGLPLKFVPAISSCFLTGFSLSLCLSPILKMNRSHVGEEPQEERYGGHIQSMPFVSSTSSPNP